MKYLIIAVFVVSFAACKKTEKLKPEVLPDTYVDPTYFGIFESALNIGVGSNGPVDSTFKFNASLWEKSADPAPYIAFDKISYNGNIMGSVDNGVKFLKFANESNWDIQSAQIGNFTYSNNAPAPLIGNAAGLIPPTFSGSALAINLQNISNADEVVVSSLYDVMDFSNSPQTVKVQGVQNYAFNYVEGVYAMPLNTDIRITISLRKYYKLTKNKVEIDVCKVTNYVYKTRKTN
jgi:hypothetical protein